MNSAALAHPGRSQSANAEKFLVLPIVILILAQMGATGDNGALSLATSALAHELGATTSEIQLANMVYPLVGGAFHLTSFSFRCELHSPAGNPAPWGPAGTGRSY